MFPRRRHVSAPEIANTRQSSASGSTKYTPSKCSRERQRTHQSSAPPEKHPKRIKLVVRRTENYKDSTRKSASNTQGTIISTRDPHTQDVMGARFQEARKQKILKVPYYAPSKNETSKRRFSTSRVVDQTLIKKPYR